MSKLLTLQQKRAKALAELRAIQDKSDPATLVLAKDDQAAFDAKKLELASIDTAIANETVLAEAERLAPAAAPPLNGNGDNGGAGRIELGQVRKELDPKGGFKAIGEFLMSVKNAGVSNGRGIDRRLVPEAGAPTTFGGEGVGADGGFLVPPQFATDIFKLTLTDEALLPMTDQTTLGNSNSMVFPKDETTPWGTNGVRAYWQAEASAATQTKPVLGTQTLRLHKLMALVPMTDELLSDSSAAGSYVTPLIARSIMWKTNEAILLGTGAGQPRGFLTNAGGTGSSAVVQAKESGQATLTVVPLNIANMMARMVPGEYGNAVWLVTPDAFPSIITLTLGNYPIYLPMTQGVQASPYGMLLGRPIHLSQHVAAFTSQGDVTLIAPSYYRTIVAEGGVQMAQSLHLYFDADVTAYRATFRLDGGPKLAAPIAQAKGSKTLSPAIQLQAR